MDPVIFNEIQSSPDNSSSVKKEKSRRRSTTEPEKNGVSRGRKQGISVRGKRKQWMSERVQAMYTTKLLQALRGVKDVTGGMIRRKADHVLALSAKGTTRWSRAILERRPRLTSLHMTKKVKLSALSDLGRKNSSPVETKRRNEKVKGKKSWEVENKLTDLRLLIPGCRKAPILDLWSETVDYVAALEMQVRVMTAITQVLQAPAVQSKFVGPIKTGGDDDHNNNNGSNGVGNEDRSNPTSTGFSTNYYNMNDNMNRKMSFRGKGCYDNRTGKRPINYMLFFGWRIRMIIWMILKD